MQLWNKTVVSPAFHVPLQSLTYRIKTKQKNTIFVLFSFQGWLIFSGFVQKKLIFWIHSPSISGWGFSELWLDKPNSPLNKCPVLERRQFPAVHLNAARLRCVLGHTPPFPANVLSYSKCRRGAMSSQSKKWRVHNVSKQPPNAAFNMVEKNSQHEMILWRWWWASECRATWLRTQRTGGGIT